MSKLKRWQEIKQDIRRVTNFYLGSQADLFTSACKRIARLEEELKDFQFDAEHLVYLRERIVELEENVRSISAVKNESIAELKTNIADLESLGEQDDKRIAELEAAIEGWKKWHKDLANTLGLEMVERSLTLRGVDRLVKAETTGRRIL